VNVLLVGMSHRSAPVEVRERFAVADPGAALAKLVDGREVEEAVLLSTCNRVEIAVVTRSREAARHRLRRFLLRELAHQAPLSEDELESHLYEHADSQAVRHVFRVASALDSMVLGEPQILGQVKDAWRAAVEAGACGPILTRLFQRAFSTAKRVKSETGVAERPVSVARVAVELAGRIFERFDDKAALLLGAGEMTELALEALRREGLRAVRVANRTPAHAELLAARFGASAHGLDELPELLAVSDVVLTSLGGERPIVSPELMRAALHRRRTRPIFVIDIGVPRNVDPAVNELDGAYLYDVDDLQDVAAANAESREREVVRAEALVHEEQQRFDGWLVALQSVPTIRHLRARADAIRAEELERALARLDLDPAQREGVEALSRAIVNKLLHAPVSRLRAEVDREEGLARLEAARTLFGLDEGDPPETGAARDPAPEPDEP
jgi:glutamyl-tRNA reductase